MVKVQVQVNGLTTYLDGQEKKFRKGDVFDCPTERVARLGTSVVILEDVPPVVPEPDANPPDDITDPAPEQQMKKNGSQKRK